MKDLFLLLVLEILLLHSQCALQHELIEKLTRGNESKSLVVVPTISISEHQQFLVPSALYNGAC